MIFWLRPFQCLGKHRSCCCPPSRHRSQCSHSWRWGRAARWAVRGHTGTVCPATTQPHTISCKGQKVLARTVLWCHLSTWEAELGTVLKQGAPELNIFTGSACVWQRASSEKHREEKEEQLLRSQNILFQRFQNSRAELFALKQCVPDEKALKNVKTILKKTKPGKIAFESSACWVLCWWWNHNFGSDSLLWSNKNYRQKRSNSALWQFDFCAFQP